MPSRVDFVLSWFLMIPRVPSCAFVLLFNLVSLRLIPW